MEENVRAEPERTLSAVSGEAAKVHVWREAS